MRTFAVIPIALAAAAYLASASSVRAAYAPLQLFTNGPGSISPLHPGEMLEVWGTYKMLAVPGPGFAFHSWERLYVWITITRSTNNTGVVSTNIETSLSSLHQFFTTPELTFVMRPATETDLGDGRSTVSTYGWRANFGPAPEPIEPEIYRTLPGATVEERGDRVWNGSRIVPFSATLTFDFSATPPSLKAVIPNAVVEGGEPFPLTVHSYYGYPDNGGYKFSGDYLQERYPTGSQYGFDWEFSAPTNGALVWNGSAGWMGGHIWYLTFTNLTLLPQALLRVTPAGTTSLQASWKMNFADHILESSAALSATDWTVVTNAVTTIGNRRSVTLEVDGSQRFYRLRKL